MATKKTGASGVAHEPQATGFIATGGTTTQKALTVTADVTLDQDLQQSASPTFAGITIDAQAITSIETTISDSDAQLPTSGAVVDYVAGLLPVTWTTVTATPQACAVNNGYIAALAAGGPLVFTLPATAAVGSVIHIIGQGPELFAVDPDNADFIRFGNLITVAGGQVLAIAANDCITLRCAVVDSVWEVVDSVGAFNVTTS